MFSFFFFFIYFQPLLKPFNQCLTDRYLVFFTVSILLKAVKHVFKLILIKKLNTFGQFVISLKQNKF